MVNLKESLDLTFAALSDPTRRAMVSQLTRGEQSVSEPAAPLPMSLVAVSKHLTVLERAGLVTRRQVGRKRMCALNLRSLGEAAGWIEQHRRFWAERLDSLEHYLVADPATAEK